MDQVISEYDDLHFQQSNQGQIDIVLDFFLKKGKRMNGFRSMLMQP